MLADLARRGPARRRAPRSARRDGAGGHRRRRGRPDRGGARGGRARRCRSRSRSTSTATSRRAMVAGADLLHGYKTYPHVDMAERGVEAAERLAEVIAGRLRPTAALPQAAAPAAARQPGHRARADAPALRPGRRDGAGPEGHLDLDLRRLPLADIPDAGLGVYVVTDDDQALAERARRPAGARRPGSIGTSSSTPRCRCRTRWPRALAADGRPIVLADMADNTGGGAAGDGTEILRELLRVGARSAVVACLWDPAAVRGLREGRRRQRRHARRRRQGRRPPRRARSRVTGARAHAVRRPLRPQGPDDARAARPARPHRGARRERREGHPDLLPLADARSRR